jgi:hypothetical protein
MKMNQRNNYSPERDLREREHYREKRREYSPNSRDDNLIDINRQHLLDANRSRENSLIVENNMLTTTTTADQLSTVSSNNDHQWREMSAVDEIDYQDRYIDTNDDNDQQDLKDTGNDNENFNTNDDYHDRHSFDRVSIDYHRDDDTILTNYERDEDRYRDDGIYV